MTRRKPEYRFHNDGTGYKSNKNFFAEIKKVGWDNIKHIIVASDLTLQEAAQLEIELIREYETTSPENGFNYVCGSLREGKKKQIKATKTAMSERFSRLRMAKNLTQEELARRVGVSQAAIWQYENGTATPKIEIAVNLAKCLGTTAEILMKGDDENG